MGCIISRGAVMNSHCDHTLSALIVSEVNMQHERIHTPCVTPVLLPVPPLSAPVYPLSATAGPVPPLTGPSSPSSLPRLAASGAAFGLAFDAFPAVSAPVTF